MLDLEDRAASPAGAARLRSVSAVVVAAAIGLASFWPILVESPVIGFINVMVVVAFTATGVVLCDELEQRRTGVALVAAAGFYCASWWWSWPTEWQVGPVALLSYVTGYLWFVLGVFALLRYPESKLARWWDRVYVALLAFWVVAPKLLLVGLSRPEWIGQGFSSDSWWPAVAPDRVLFDQVSMIVGLGLVVTAAPVVVPLLLKVRRSRSIDRIEAVPGMAAAATVMVCGSVYLLAQFWSLSDATVDVLRAVIGVAALFTPLAFLTSALRRRLARASMADLIVRLVDSPEPAAVQEELRRSLPDPTLTLWFWLPEHDVFVDVEDQVSDRVPDDGRYRIRIPSRDGSLLAVLTLDPALRRVPTLVAPAVAACRFALENSRMHVAERARFTELREATNRIAQAELVARQKIERDLHDGVQSTLMAVRARLGAARQKTPRDSDAYDAIRLAQVGLRTATEELRQLARGIAPPILTQSGPAIALEGVAERLGIGLTGCRIPDRFAPAVENVTYFVATEAITNAVKHAGVESVHLTLSRVGDLLTLRVSDDGPGGADGSIGTGLTGMSDRARSLGGTLRVDSPVGGGTNVVLELPCR